MLLWLADYPPSHLLILSIQTYLIVGILISSMLQDLQRDCRLQTERGIRHFLSWDKVCNKHCLAWARADGVRLVLQCFPLHGNASSTSDKSVEQDHLFCAFLESSRSFASSSPLPAIGSLACPGVKWNRTSINTRHLLWFYGCKISWQQLL